MQRAFRRRGRKPRVCILAWAYDESGEDDQLVRAAITGRHFQSQGARRMCVQTRDRSGQRAAILEKTAISGVTILRLIDGRMHASRLRRLDTNVWHAGTVGPRKPVQYDAISLDMH